jgi:hypothetical protein
MTNQTKIQWLIIGILLIFLAIALVKIVDKEILFDCWVIRTKQNILTDNSTNERARLQTQAEKFGCQEITEQEILENF